MKTLIIHPADESTDFLKPIYANVTGDVTIVTGGYTKDEVRQMILEADRVMMMGHGSPNGLFSVGQFGDTKNGMIIDATMLTALARKPNNVYIWCNADRFVEYFHLNGFYSGMFVSEYGEAVWCKVPTVIGDVEVSNDLFAEIVGKNIMMEAKNIHDNTKLLYHIEGNKVAKYNNERLYWR